MKGQEAETRFLADRMLGRLARYLRLLGYDVAYPPPGPDSALMARARSENRVLLTRDRGICERAAAGAPVVVEILSDAVLEQVEQLRSQGWLAGRLPPRCCECNRRLEEIPRLEAMQLVPPYVHSAHIRYVWCPGCNAVYWEGSHWECFRADLGSAEAHGKTR